MVESQFVVLVVAGSSPVGHPILPSSTPTGFSVKTFAGSGSMKIATAALSRCGVEPGNPQTIDDQVNHAGLNLEFAAGAEK